MDPEALFELSLIIALQLSLIRWKEGADRIIDKIQSLANKGFRGLIINPGAYTHYSYAIRDAIKASGLKTVEVHLSDIEKREEFRKVSVIKEVCEAQIKGLGIEGYVKALEILLE